MDARRLVMATFSTLCVLAGALTFGGAPALAAAPETPETGTASAVTARTATLEGGVLNPKATVAVAPGEYEYLFRASAGNCEGERAAPEPAGIALGMPKEHVEPPVALTNLQPNAQYTFCLIEYNAEGASHASTPGHFTTPPAPPTVEGRPASSVKASQARLEGAVNPNNQVTECKFQYGTEASLATSTTAPCEPASLEGFGGQGVGLTVGGLEARKIYYYRVVATNASGTETGPIEHFTTPTPPEAPETDKASAVTASTATLHGVLNPHSKREFEPGTYEFRYRQSATECQGENEKAQSGPAPQGHEAEAAQAEVTGLLPGTDYTFCLLALNNAQEAALGQPVTFKTAAVAPSLGEEWITGVASGSATFNAQVNPGGAETMYRFEYGTTTSYGANPATEYSAGSGIVSAPVELHVQQGLQPDTTYHYRIVVSNEVETVYGPDRTFTTQRAPQEESTLPDGRQYELVSPPLKDGAEILGIGGGGETPGAGDATQASEDGTSVTYIANAPVSTNGPGNTYSTQLFSTRSAAGWSSQDISNPHIHAVETFINEGEEFLRFSSDLSRAVLVPVYVHAEPPLAPEVHQEVSRGQEIYLRNDATGVFQALDTSEPLPRAVETEPPEIAFEGASPDLSHVVFLGPPGLDSKYPTAGGLYEWYGGHSQLVSVLPGPGGAPTSGLLGGANPGFQNGMNEGSSVIALHAISDDGTRVFWTAGESYMRDTATNETIPIHGAFQMASGDGSRAFVTEGPKGGDLFMFDVATQKRIDLTPDPNGAQVQTVIGAAENGTSVYVFAKGVLTEAANGENEVAKAGAKNLYLLREAPAGSGSWSTTFITAGAEEGHVENGANSARNAPFATQTSRVSPSGRYLAFMSQQSLTGYDNHDANSGQPDMEVYLFDAETNKLVCASCDPTGARPVGELDIPERFPGLPIDAATIWGGDWLAATVPGLTADGSEATTGYQPRFLSDSGRLFFDSTDGLVPQDVNGLVDVYEYEPSGVGSCQAPDYGQSASVVFSATADGCVGLISAGTGSDDSLFFDASASGNDVFFTTEDGLVSQDKDGVADMYDARVCTTAEPCPASVTSPPPCATADSCRAAPEQQPGVFGATGSATFSGAGNVVQSAPVAKPMPKKAVRKAKRKKKKKKGKRRKRAKKSNRRRAK
jgi:hypothetical protein